MAVKARLSPSPEARALYCEMVQRAEGDILSLEQTLELSVELVKCGKVSARHQSEYTRELVREEWIVASATDEGGWVLDPKPLPPLY